MERFRGRPSRGTFYREVLRAQDRSIGMKTYLQSPMDYAKKLKLRFRVGDLDLPDRRKDIYQ